MIPDKIFGTIFSGNLEEIFEEISETISDGDYPQKYPKQSLLEFLWESLGKLWKEFAKRVLEQ